MRLARGKTPARHDPRALKFARYRTDAKPPPHPASFGEENLVGDFHMLGNDVYGDCVFAGAAHEHMLATRRLSATRARFTTRDVLSDYAAATGFRPNDPSTDQGTDMTLAANYRRKIGVLDATGVRRRIGAFVALRPGDLEQHLEAAWLFGAVGIGVTIGQRQEDQFDAGEPWDGPPGADAGGHYVPLVGFRDGLLHVVSWGRAQAMTPAFLRSANDESLAYVNLDLLRAGRSPEGFDIAALDADLAVLAAEA